MLLFFSSQVVHSNEIPLITGFLFSSSSRPYMNKPPSALAKPQTALLIARCSFSFPSIFPLYSKVLLSGS